MKDNGCSVVGKGVISKGGDIIYNEDTKTYGLHHQKMKKIFIQLGNRHNLPIDIIDYLYSILYRTLKLEEETSIRFHRNSLLLNVMVENRNYKDLTRMEPIFKSYETEDQFSYRIPEKRGCEWAIKNSTNKKLIFDNDNSLLRIKDTRERLFLEILILGEKNYLFDLNCTYHNVNYKRYMPAEKELKLRYLNNSSFEEIYSDYQNFLDVKGGDNESNFTLLLDGAGDAMYFVNTEIPN